MQRKGTRRRTCFAFKFILCILFDHCVLPVDSDKVLSRIVNTKYGKIQGFIRHNSRPSLRPIEVYLGVPYASPPVGLGRFTPTSSPLPWDHVRTCDRLSPVCPQPLWDKESVPPHISANYDRYRPILQNQNEDCLYLNIYSPHDGGGKKYPVFVFIHGDSFKWGSGNLFDGGILSSYGQIVVVIVNYRLGPLGFLNTSPGGKTTAVVSNQGLMDQLAALTWVKENIEAFGGDSERITLAGHSTGAACIGYLLASPVVVPGLFHRVILMSGSPLNPWSEVPDALSVTVRLAKLLGCSVPSDLSSRHPETMSCLRNISSNDLVNAPMPNYKFASVFGPSVDGIVITKNFLERLRMSTKKNDISLLFGVSVNDALSELTTPQARKGFDMAERNRIFRTFVRNTYHFHLQEIYLSIAKEYTNWENPSHHPLEIKDLTVSAINDGSFLAPLIRFADIVSSRSKSYMYVFSHKERDTDSISLTSSSEVSLLFGGPFQEIDYNIITGSDRKRYQQPLIASVGNFSKMDAVVSEYLMRYFSNFAKSGNPNKPDESQSLIGLSQRTANKNVSWETYDPIFEKYLEISSRPRLRDHYRAHKVALWNWLLPELEDTGSKYPDAESERWHKSDDEKYFIGPVRPLDPFRFLRTTPSVRTIGKKKESLRDSYLTPNVSAAQRHPTKINEPSPDQSDEQSLLDYTTALTLTIAIGLSLLVLNVILFAALLYKRDRPNLNPKMKYDSVSVQPLCTVDSGLRSTPTIQENPTHDKELQSPCGQSDPLCTELQSFPTPPDIGDRNTEFCRVNSPQSILSQPTSQFIPPPPLLSTTPPTPTVSSSDKSNFNDGRYHPEISSRGYSSEVESCPDPAQCSTENTNVQPSVAQCIDAQIISTPFQCSCNQTCSSPVPYCTEECRQYVARENYNSPKYTNQNMRSPSSSKRYFREPPKNSSYCGGGTSTFLRGQSGSRKVSIEEASQSSRNVPSYATLPRQDSRDGNLRS